MKAKAWTPGSKSSVEQAAAAPREVDQRVDVLLGRRGRSRRPCRPALTRTSPCATHHQEHPAGLEARPRVCAPATASPSSLPIRQIPPSANRLSGSAAGQRARSRGAQARSGSSEPIGPRVTDVGLRRAHARGEAACAVDAAPTAARLVAAGLAPAGRGSPPPSRRSRPRRTARSAGARRASIRYLAGQYWLRKAFQVAKSLSWATG